MQFISGDKTARSNTIQILYDFGSQSLEPPAKKGEKIVPMMPAINKSF